MRGGRRRPAYAIPAVRSLSPHPCARESRPESFSTRARGSPSGAALFLNSLFDHPAQMRKRSIRRDRFQFELGIHIERLLLRFDKNLVLMETLQDAVVEGILNEL